MKKIVLAAFAVILCFSQAFAYDEDKTPAIEVRGKATTKVVPDELYISIELDENDYKGKYTLKDKQDELISILHKFDVDVDNDLKVCHMGSTVKFGVLRKQTKSMVAASYVAKVNGIDNMYGIIKALGKKEISNVSLVETRYSQKEELELELATKAVKDAMKRARVLSDALGQQLGSALQVYVRPMYSIDPSAKYRNAVSKGAAAEENYDALERSSSELSVFEIEYKIEVTAKFELLGR